MTGVANRPFIVAALGATGSGKSLFVHALITRRAPRRLLVWDFSPEDEYARHCHYVGFGELVEELTAAGQRLPFALAVHPSPDPAIRARQFDLFCTAAYRVGSCMLVIEELRFVTKPSWAPVPWQQVILTGRKRGLEVIGTSQRPAHVDKDFLSSATLVHVGCLGYEEDEKTAARELRVPLEQLHALAPLDWIEADRSARPARITTGRISP